MKLLLDQGIPRSSAAILRAAGLDVVHTGEVGRATAADDDLVGYALEEGRVIITLDADFHALLALSGARAPSVVRIRIQGLKAEDIASLVPRILAVCGEDLDSGALVTVDGRTVRVRFLPLDKRA